MSTDSRSRVVLVRNRGQRYEPRSIVRLIEGPPSQVYDLVEDPRGRYEVYSCDDVRVDQDRLLRVELRLLRPD
jgi:hypothetical protein